MEVEGLKKLPAQRDVQRQEQSFFYRLAVVIMHPIYQNSTAVLMAVCLLGLVSGPATAKVWDRSSGATEQLSALEPRDFGFIPPEDSGQPNTNRAGGRRDQLCNNAVPTPSLTLLLPETNHGLTTAARPTVLAYVPSTPAEQVFLTLEDEANNYVYHTTFELSEGGGVASFSIPATAPELEPGKFYKISLALVCGQRLDPNDPVVEGWIKRIELSETRHSPSDPATALELGSWYARNGIWFDAVQVLADLRRVTPNSAEVVAAWEELLTSVGLDEISALTLLSYTNE